MSSQARDGRDMFTVEWNKAIWDTIYPWSAGGNEWSGAWGGVEMQWHRTLLPRLHPFLPTGTLLEIAPGYGRWTQKLKDLCQEMYLVDLASKCIETCRRRFQNCTHLHYHVNDGRSLDRVPDRAIDFAFSFDSLVHVERPVIRSYLDELGRVLAADGVAFLHHSNLGDYARRLWLLDRLPLVTRLERWGLIERNPHYRATDVSAGTVAEDAVHAGLQCITQELVNWGSRRLIDCFSVVTRAGSRWARPNRVVRNRHFWDEIHDAARLATCYGCPATPS
jgi:SAM-dependent methyltransferase